MKNGTIIGLVALAVFVAVLMADLFSSASTFADFETAKREGKTVHVVGRWVQRDQAVFDPARSFNSFYIEDTLKKVEEVHYYGALTGDMGQADKIDIVGKYENDVFVAKKIHMKCPSKYNNADGEFKQADARKPEPAAE